MRILPILMALTFSSISYAGPGGGHSHSKDHSHDAPPINRKKTVEIGRKQIQRLIKVKKLDASWLMAVHNESKIKRNEWVVTFGNKEGVKGKVLYIFLKISGEFVAANFTGK